MNTPIIVAPPYVKVPHQTALLPPPPTNEAVELLRAMLDIQREQLVHARNAAVAADSLARWRNFLARWQNEFPDIGQSCKDVLPTFERTYLRLIQDLASRLTGDDADDLENEYVLAEFLDKYGLRLSQLGTIIGQLSPIADATPPPAPAPTETSE